MNKMNILLLGGGGRENALAWKITQSRDCTSLFIAPGNPGTALLGTNLPIKADDFGGIKKAVIEHKINFVICGPEDPIAKGIADFFRSDDDLKTIPILAPSAKAGQLESSKDFAKEFMMKYDIPTAKYKTFTKGQYNEAMAFVKANGFPIVLKADGLAAGKGVSIPISEQEAEDFFKEVWNADKFGVSGNKVVIEQFLTGIELSVFILTDGKNYVLLPEAKDYKRIGEGDTGPNTGGMGSISPVPFATPELMEKIRLNIIEPTLNGIQKEKLDYRGFIFFGLIITNAQHPTPNTPFVIEYNVRMGDPETESVMPRIKSDIVPLMYAAALGRLQNQTLEFDDRYAACVIAVSGGYPNEFEKGKVISGLDKIKDSLVFHAGTKEEDGKIVSSGGRVFAITSLADNLETVLAQTYNSLSDIHFEAMYFRRDIGKDVLGKAFK